MADLNSLCWPFIQILCYLGAIEEFFHATTISMFLYIKFNQFIKFPILLHQGRDTAIDSRDLSRTCGIHKAFYKIRQRSQYKWDLFLPLGNHNTFSLLPNSLPQEKAWQLLTTVCICKVVALNLMYFHIYWVNHWAAVCAWCVSPAADMKTSSSWDTNQH